MRLTFIFLLTLFICSQKSYAQNDSIDIWRKQLQQTKDGYTKAQLNEKIGVYHFSKSGKLDSALLYYESAAQYYKKHSHLKDEGYISTFIAQTLLKREQFQQATKYANAAEKIFLQIKDTIGMARILRLKSQLLQPRAAIRQLKKSIELCLAINNKRYIPYSQNDIGTAYFKLNMFDSAILYYTKGIEEAKAQNNERILGYSYYNLGSFYIKTKKYKAAETNLKKALEIFEKSNTTTNVGWIIPDLVKLYLVWRQEEPNSFNNRISNNELYNLLRRSSLIAEKGDDFFYKISLAESYIQYYEQIDNPRKVVTYQKELIKLKERLADKEIIETSAKYAEELKTADKEKEIIQLNADKKIASATANRNKIIFFLILLGLLSSIYFIVKRIKYKNLKEQEERDKNFRSKLSSDLHDDVGTILTSLSMQSELLEIKASESNKGTVAKIADMSRDATRRMRDTVWAIDSRKDNVMDLAYRMIDFADDMLGAKDVEFQLAHNIEGKDDRISAELRQTIFLIFKETITNAAKYGTGKIVTASLHKEKESLKLKVENETENVVDLEKISGLGLSNIKKRIEDMNGVVAFNNAKNKFEVALTFPI